MSPPHMLWIRNAEEVEGVFSEKKREARRSPASGPPPRPGNHLQSSQREKQQSSRGGEHVVSSRHRVANCRNERNGVMDDCEVLLVRGCVQTWIYTSLC